MKKKRRIMMALLSVLLLGACSFPGSGQSAKGEEGSIITAEFPTVEGQRVRLEDYKGKKIYIKFWASWCPICLASLSDSDHLAANEEDDIVVLSVVAPGYRGEQTEEDFTKWYRTLDYKSLPVLLDKEKALIEEYQILAYPSSVFIDSEGNFVEKHSGYISAKEITEKMKGIH